MAQADTTSVPSANPIAAPATAGTAIPTPRIPATYSWTGFYIGGHVDFGQGNADTTFDPLPSAAQFINLLPTTLSPDPSGTGFRLTAGANHAMGRLVIGAEGDWAMPRTDGTAVVTPIIQNNGTPLVGSTGLTASQSTDWIITGRGRIGVAFGRVLVFGAGGVAFGSVNYHAETNFRPAGSTNYVADLTEMKTGWTVGGGVEVRINQRIGVRGEYRYMDLGSQSATADTTPVFPPFQVANSWKTQSTTYSGGVIIHF